MKPFRFALDLRQVPTPPSPKSSTRSHLLWLYTEEFVVQCDHSVRVWQQLVLLSKILFRIGKERKQLCVIYRKCAQFEEGNTPENKFKKKLDSEAVFWFVFFF